MGEGRIGAPEFERLVTRIGNADYLARPYSGKRDGMPVSECVRMAFLQDSSVMMASGTMTGVNPLIVRMAYARAVNALAVRAVHTTTAALLLTVPKQMPEEQLRPYMREAFALTKLSDVEIVRTNTDFVTAHITVSGNPMTNIPKAEYPDGEYSIVMCGNAGAEMTVLLYEQHRKRLELKYPRHFLAGIPELADGLVMVKACETGFANGAVFGYACSDGGVYAGLFGMGERLRTGMKVNLPDIAISQKTIEVCEELDIDPYRIGSGGCIFLITPDTQTLLGALYEAGFDAQVIGTISAEAAREIHNGDEVRFLEPFRGSEM